MEALSKEKEIRDNQVKALARMETVVAQMKDCLTSQNMVEVTEKALDGGIDALSQLANIMV